MCYCIKQPFVKGMLLNLSHRFLDKQSTCPPRSPSSSRYCADQVQLSTTITFLSSALSWSRTGVHHDHLLHLSIVLIKYRCPPRSPSSPQHCPDKVHVSTTVTFLTSALSWSSTCVLTSALSWSGRGVHHDYLPHLSIVLIKYRFHHDHLPHFSTVLIK